jgi:hypothetical protein
MTSQPLSRSPETFCTWPGLVRRASSKQPQNVAMVAYITTTPSTQQQPRQSSAKCLFRQKNHATDDCRLFRSERRDGEMVVVSSEMKKKPPRQRKAKRQSSGLVIRGSISNSSLPVVSSPLGSTGLALVLDTGTTVNVLKDKSLFTSTSPCDEVVYGVGGGKYRVKLKGGCPTYPDMSHNLISFRSLSTSTILGSGVMTH